MPTSRGKPMSPSERARFHQEIYAPNTGPDGITTDDILKGCKQAEALLTPSFLETVKKSPFYLRNQLD